MWNFLKKIISGCLALVALMPLWAKHPGEYLNVLSNSYVTPHWMFGQGEKRPLKTLFIMSRRGARDAIEIQQRTPMKAQYFLTYNSNNFICEDMYEGAIEGTSRFEKEAELNRKLNQNYEVCVIGQFPFDRLPEEAQFRLLTAVQNGMGLVIVNPYNAQLPPYKKLFQRTLSIPQCLKNFAQPAKNLKLAAWQLGKGKIIAVSWKRSPWINVQDRSCLPLLDYSNQWVTEHENSAAFMGMICRFAAGRTLNIVQPQIRIRNRWNQEVKTSKLPAGTYFRDELGRNGAFHIAQFEVKNHLGQGTLFLPEVVKKHQSFKGKLTLSGMPQGAGRVIIELLDSPYQRIWHRQEIPLTAGQKSFSFEVKNYPMPTLAGYVRATVQDSHHNAELIVDQVVFFPDASVPDYAQLGWDSLRGSTGALLAPQLIDRLEWRMGLTHPSPDGVNIRQMAMLNQKLVCYTTRIMLEKSSNGGVKQGNWFFLPPELKVRQQKLKGDECFYRPEVQELWRISILNRIKNLKKYSTAIYSLGDENNRNPDAGFGPSDEKYFRRFLKNKYKTIANLNYNYRSNYHSFSEVPHTPLQVAKAKGNFAAWADHRAYMDKMYADLHVFLRDVIREYDPEAQVGAEGSVPGELEQTIEKLEYWGPYHDRIEDELLRSFGGDKFRMLWWGGYPGSHGGRGEFAESLLRDMLLGTINGNAWFSTEPGSNHSCFGCDFTIADYVKRYLPDLERLAAGTANLMIKNPLHFSGVGIYWSHASDVALLATGRGIGPRDGIIPLLDCAYKYGYGFEFISARTLERLKHTKVLFLCGASALSDRECQALLDFVKNGGTIVADVVPADYTENLRVREVNPLAPLFGAVTWNNWCLDSKYRNLELKGAGQAQKTRIFAPQTLIWRNYGTGRVLLGNFSFSSAANSANPTGAFKAWLQGLVSDFGVKTEVALQDETNDKHIMRIRKNKDFLLVGVMVTAKNMKSNLPLTFNKPYYVYAVDKNFIGKRKHLNVKFDQSPLQLYALFDQVQSVPRFKVAPVQRGQFLHLDLPPTTSGRIWRLEIWDQTGKKYFKAVYDCPDNLPHPAIAYNANPGQWTAQLTDVATGLNKKIIFEVK